MRDEEMSRSSGFEEVSERTQSTRMKRSGGSTVDLVCKISSIVNNCSDRNELSERIRDSLMETRGYPLKIKGDDILLEARILAVADVVEAMSSHRPYRHSLGTEAEIEEINRKSGLLYDSDVLSACAEVFGEGFQFTPEAASTNFGL